MKLTVGIATWNRAALLAQTLEGLTQLRVPPEVQWEVLVCDNNSTDDTRAVVAKEIALARLPLQYLHEPQQGQGHAHNRIVTQMSGDWLMILDDDVQVDPDWMVSYVEAIKRYPRAGCLAGQVLPWTSWEPRGLRAYLLEQFPWVQAVLRFERDLPFTRGCGQYPHGPNMAFRADVLREKSFDPHKGMKGKQRGLGEDTDYALSVVDRGYEAWLVTANKVRHYIPYERAGLRWFCHWHAASGRLLRLEKGPAPAGSGGLRLWHYQLIGRLLLLSLGRRFVGRKKQAYETLAEACTQWGYLQASRHQAP